MQTEYLTFIAEFKVQGRFAYLSHQETLSFWQRVLVRAHVPLVYSHGFNPRPRLSLPLPRSVGVQSECERLCALVEAEGFCPDVVRSAILPLLPDGCLLTATDTAAGKASYYPVSAVYRFVLCEAPNAARRDRLQQCIRHTRDAAPVMLARHMENGRERPIDIRPFLEGLSSEGQTIQAACAILPSGTVRIDELMRWLQLEPNELAEPVRRTAVRWASTPHPLQGEHHLS